MSIFSSYLKFSLRFLFLSLSIFVDFCVNFFQHKTIGNSNTCNNIGRKSIYNTIFDRAKGSKLYTGLGIQTSIGQYFGHIFRHSDVLSFADSNCMFDVGNSSPMETISFYFHRSNDSTIWLRHNNIVELCATI